MRFPPIFLVFRTFKNRKKTFGFWFPIIIIWIILFAFVLALSPLVLIAALILWQRGIGKMLLLSGPMFFNVLGSLKGLVVNVGSTEKEFLIAFV